jgi:hypothetical protein
MNSHKLPPFRMPDSSPNPLLVGQRVRVRIASMERWNQDAGARLNGTVGTIEQHKPHSYNGEPCLTDAYLVRFGTPVAREDGWQPWESHWFATCDLEVLPTDCPDCEHVIHAGKCPAHECICHTKEQTSEEDR